MKLGIWPIRNTCLDVISLGGATVSVFFTVTVSTLVRLSISLESLFLVKPTLISFLAVSSFGILMAANCFSPPPRMVTNTSTKALSIL